MHIEVETVVYVSNIFAYLMHFPGHKREKNAKIKYLYVYMKNEHTKSVHSPIH